MKRISLSLFESIMCCTLIFNVVFFPTTFFLVISIINPQPFVVYQSLVVAYIACFLFLTCALLVCNVVGKREKHTLILLDKTFTIHGQSYDYDSIRYAEYFVCKWYAIPLAPLPIYKGGCGGLVKIRLNTGRKILFKILYHDYLKLSAKMKIVKK